MDCPSITEKLVQVISMYDVCANCGEYRIDKDVDPTGSYLICPNCGFKQRFQYLPLFVVTGASGTGKSTLLREILMIDDRPDLVYLDSDMLLIEEFTKDGWQAYKDIWLWICLNISQSRRPVVLFGSANPEDFESVPRRRYLSEIHYLALTCSESVLESRLLARPEWRKSSRPEFVKAHIDWNQRFLDNAPNAVPQYSILDTTDKSKERCARDVIQWINTYWRE